MLDAFVGHELQRADSYRLLASCFYEPQKDLFLQADLFANLTTGLSGVNPSAAQSAAILQDLWVSSTEEELLVEYARLFLGPNRLLAPPYGSCYLDEERLLMGKSTLEVLRIYRENGLVIDEHFKEAPDHITVELEFQYFLILQQVKALEEGEIEEAVRLLNVHAGFRDVFLKKWIPPFTENIIENTTSEFYRQLAKCLNLFIEDEGWLEKVPERMRVHG
jgi:putative dimethyl sulfoxide reductase chaperone